MTIEDPRMNGIGGLKGLKGVGSKLPEEQQKQIDLLDFSVNYNPALSNPDLFTGGDFNIPQTPDYGESKYDKKLPTLDEYLDYNQLRAVKQPSIAKIGNSLAKMGTTAAATFVDNIVGLSAGIINVIVQGEYGNGQGLYNFVNNPVSKALNDFNETLKKSLPTYLTEAYQTNRENGEWWKNIGSSAWWGEQLESAGFMVGAMASGAVSSAAIAKGLGTAQLRQVIKNTVKMSAKDGALEGALRNAGSLNNIASVLNSSAKSLRKHNIVNKTLSGLLAANGEARLEAINTANEIDSENRQQIEDYYHKQMEMIASSNMSQEEKAARIAALQEKYKESLTVLADDIKTASNTVFGLNLITLWASDVLAMGKCIGTGFRYDSAVQNIVRRESNKEVEKRLGKEGLREVLRSEAKGGTKGFTARQFVSTKPKKDLIRGLASPLREGTDEMLQGSYSEGMSQYAASDINEFYNYKVNPKGAENTLSLFNALGEGFRETWGTSAGWEQFASGAIAGILPIPFVNMRFKRATDENGQPGRLKVEFNNEMFQSFKDNANMRKRAEAMSSQLNNIISDKKYNILFEGLTAADILSEKEQIAMTEQDKFEAITAKNQSFINMVNMFDRLGRKQEIIDLLEEVADADKLTGSDREDFARDMIEQTAVNGESPIQNMSTDEIIEYASRNARENLEKIDDYTSISESMHELFSAVDGYDNGESFIDNMTWITANIHSLEKRFGSISQHFVDSANKVLGAARNVRKDEDEVDAISKLNDMLKAASNPDEILKVYSSKEMQQALDNALESLTGSKSSYEIIDLYNITKDMAKMHNLRNQYIRNFEQLAGNPTKYYNAQVLQDDMLALSNLLKSANAFANSIYAPTFYDLKRELERADKPLKNATLDALSNKGNTLAKDYNKIQTLYDKVNDALNAEKDEILASNAKNIFEDTVNSAKSLTDITNMNFRKPDYMSDMDFVDASHLLAKIISGHIDNSKGSMNTSLNSQENEGNPQQAAIDEALAGFNVVDDDTQAPPENPPTNPPANPPAENPPTPPSKPTPPADSPEDTHTAEGDEPSANHTTNKPPQPQPEDTVQADDTDNASQNTNDVIPPEYNEEHAGTDPNSYHEPVIVSVQTKSQDVKDGTIGKPITEAKPTVDDAIEYEFLKSCGTFDFLDGLNMHVGMVVKFAICPELDDMFKNFNKSEYHHKVLAYVEDDYGNIHIVGSISNPRGVSMAEKIDFEMQDGTAVKRNINGHDMYLSNTYQYPVTNMRCGIVNFTDNFVDLREAIANTPAETVDNGFPLIGFVGKDKRIITRHDDSIDTIHPTGTLKSGSVQMLIPTGKFRYDSDVLTQSDHAYVSVGLQVNEFTREYYDANKDKAFVKEIDKLVDSVARSTDDESLTNAMKALKGYLTDKYSTSKKIVIGTYDLSTQSGRVDNVNKPIDLKSVLIQIKVDRKVVANINASHLKPGSDERNIDSIKAAIMDAIFAANMRINVSGFLLHDTNYVNCIVDSGLLKVNMNKTEVKGVSWSANVVSPAIEPLQPQQQGQVNDNNLQDSQANMNNDTSILFDDDDSNFTSIQNEPANEPLDIARELSVIRKFIPQISNTDAVIIHNALINHRGVMCGGLFRSGIIELSKRAKEGTAYHEAFHYVMHSIMSEYEYRDVLAEAKKVYGSNTDRELEERMADDFATYVEDMESKKQSNILKRIGEKIMSFFKKLFAVKQIANTNMNNLFKQIYSGKYADREIRTTSYTARSIQEIDFSKEDKFSILRLMEPQNEVVKRLKTLDPDLLKKLDGNESFYTYAEQYYKGIVAKLKKYGYNIGIGNNKLNIGNNGGAYTTKLVDITINGVKILQDNFDRCKALQESERRRIDNELSGVKFVVEDNGQTAINFGEDTFGRHCK